MYQARCLLLVALQIVGYSHADTRDCSFDDIFPGLQYVLLLLFMAALPQTQESMQFFLIPVCYPGSVTG